MEAKIEKISELFKLLSVKTRMSDDLFHLFGKFGIGHLIWRTTSWHSRYGKEFLPVSNAFFAF